MIIRLSNHIELDNTSWELERNGWSLCSSNMSNSDDILSIYKFMEERAIRNVMVYHEVITFDKGIDHWDHDEDRTITGKTVCTPYYDLYLKNSNEYYKIIIKLMLSHDHTKYGNEWFLSTLTKKYNWCFLNYNREISETVKKENLGETKGLVFYMNNSYGHIPNKWVLYFEHIEDLNTFVVLDKMYEER